MLLRQQYYIVSWHAIPHILNNIFLLALPLTNLVYAHEYTVTILSGFLLLTAIAIGVFAYTKNKPQFLYLVFWIIVAFVPTSFFTWDPYISRYAYLPAIGYVLGIGYCIRESQGRVLKTILIFSICLYTAVNIFFTHKVLTIHYKPIHEENKAFLSALDTAMYDTKTSRLVIYDNTPIKGFILPDVIHSLYTIPKEQVFVYPISQPCGESETCLFWDSRSKTISVIPSTGGHTLKSM